MTTTIVTRTQALPRLLLCTAAALMLAACAQSSSADTATKTSPKVPSKASMPYQKPGIPLTLTHGKAVAVAPGETATLSLTLQSDTDATAVLLMSSKTDLVVRGASRHTVALRAGEAQTFDVAVQTPTAGRHYLDVVASLEGMDGTRATSLPVQVGAGGVVGKSQPGDLVMGADETPMITMPAAETINGVVVRDPMKERQEVE